MAYIRHNTGPKDRTFTIRLSEEEYINLHRVADITHRPASAVLRLGLELFSCALNQEINNRD
jgi:predicted transcriptional regulator